MTPGTHPAPHGRRRGPATLLAGVLGAGFVGFIGFVAQDSANAVPACRIEFNSSDNSPTVGEDITLSWSSAGADQLLASWTTSDVPAQGKQVTTKDTAGNASYQVTGLKDGQYCGGARVNVVFSAASQQASSSAAPTTSAAESSSTPSTDPSTSAAEPTTSAAPSSSAVSFPAQSPTGGESVPWFAQPVNLAILGVVSLLGSLALFNRDRLRAVLLRRH